MTSNCAIATFGVIIKQAIQVFKGSSTLAYLSHAMLPACPLVNTIRKKYVQASRHY